MTRIFSQVTTKNHVKPGVPLFQKNIVG